MGRSRNIIFVTVTTLLITTACGGNKTRSLNPIEKPEVPGGVKTSVCYLGELNLGNSCFDLEDLDATKAKYLDPFTDTTFNPNLNKNQYRKPIRSIHIPSVDTSVLLTPNFKFIEFMRPHVADFGIYSAHVLGLLQKIRDALSAPITINSGFRSPEYNSGLDGAAKWSRHQYGDAVDFKATGVSLEKLEQMCIEMGATYTDTYVNHVHCDWRKEKLDNRFFGEEQQSELQVTANLEMQQLLIADLNARSKILIQGSISRGQIVRLSSLVPYQEDPEELYKKWTIVTPNGELSFEGPTVFLSLTRGEYTIIHQIGSNIQLRKTLRVL